VAGGHHRREGRGHHHRRPVSEEKLDNELENYWKKSGDEKVIERFEEIIEDGLNAFEKVFGFRSVHFNSPGRSEHKIVHEFLFKNGIKYIDTPIVKKEHQGKGKYKTELFHTGKFNKFGMIHNVRNVVFEPTEDKGIDWVKFAITQIESAFRWNRPAIISSHRVNFCGNISESNRQTGIGNLKRLLNQIILKWPEAEFMSSSTLMEILRQQRKV